LGRSVCTALANFSIQISDFSVQNLANVAGNLEIFRDSGTWKPVWISPAYFISKNIYSPTWDRGRVMKGSPPSTTKAQIEHHFRFLRSTDE
jgi:hypothetical protein